MSGFTVDNDGSIVSAPTLLSGFTGDTPPQYTYLPMLSALSFDEADPICDVTCAGIFDDVIIHHVYEDQLVDISYCDVSLPQLAPLYRADERALNLHGTFLYLCALIDRDIDELKKKDDKISLPNKSSNLTTYCSDSLGKAWNKVSSTQPGLKWNPTVEAVLDSIYSNLGASETPPFSFNSLIAFDQENVEQNPATRKTRDAVNGMNWRMVQANLFGDDSKNSDRYDASSGYPLAIEKVSPDVRKNYLIIYLSILHGMIRYQLEH